MAEVQEKKQQHVLPEGRVINENLFILDAFKGERGEPGVPSYKLELAFDPKDIEGEGTFEDMLIEAACAEWGDAAEQEFLDGKILTPLKSGDEMAADRESRGKVGDAYKGKVVVRAKSFYNLNGAKGEPGGMRVYGPDNEPIPFLRREEVYNGCYGHVAVVIDTYIDNKKQKGLTLYMTAFQKTRDGERLVTAAASPFKPVGRVEGATTTRKRRAG